jgi:hypothetical protein
MTLTTVTAQVPVARLSFTDCLRRIRDTLQLGVPGWVPQQYARPFDWLIGRLAQCRLPTRRRALVAEPRAVRRRPAIFPALKGSRQDARHQMLVAIRTEVDRMVNS